MDTAAMSVCMKVRKVRMHELYDKNMERLVLGALIHHPDMFYDVSQLLGEDDFAEKVNKDLYKVIRDLIDKNGTADYNLVFDAIKARKLDISASYFSTMADNGVSANALFYAQKVKDLSIRRQLRVLCLTYAEKVKDQAVDADDILHDAETGMIGISENVGVDYVAARDVIHPTIERIEERYKQQGEHTGVPSDLSAIDKILNGFQRSEVIVVGARASIGKTAFGLTIAANAAARVPVGFFSLEQSKEQMTERLFSMYGNINSHRIKTGFMSDVDFNNIHTAGEYIYNSKLFYYDKPSASMVDIKAKARRLKMKEKIELLVIDYIGLVKNDYNLPRHEQISKTSKAIKELARELNIPILVLAQLNRLAEGKKPSLSELKESGALEEDADVVILLHRDRDDESIVTRTEANILKNRNGETGDTIIGFNKKIMRFVDMEG